MGRDFERGQPARQGYDVDDNRYVGFCGCHVKECAIFWAIFQMVILGGITLVFVEYYSEYAIQYSHRLNVDQVWVMFFVGGILFLLILLNGLVIYGIKKVKPYALLPILFLQTLSCTLNTIALFAKPSAFLTVILGWIIFYYNIRAYQYLNDLKKSQRTLPTAPPAYTPIIMAPGQAEKVELNN